MVGNWANYSSLIMTIFSAVAIVASILWGSSIGDEVMKFTPVESMIRSTEGKNSIVWQIYIIPILLSLLPLLMLHSSAKLFHGSSIFPSLITIFNLFLISVGMFIRNSIDLSILDIKPRDVLNHIPVVEGIIAVAIWGVVYLYLR